jgi:tyrosyl-tRNA synthetase
MNQQLLSNGTSSYEVHGAISNEPMTTEKYNENSPCEASSAASNEPMVYEILNNAHETTLNDAQETTLNDALETILNDALETTLNDAHETTLNDAQETKLNDALETKLNDALETTLNDTCPETKLNLIKRNLQEIMGEDILRKIILEDKTQLSIYWGTAPTGKIHIGYLIQFLKIADYLSAGCKVKILIADIHAYLDSMKSNLEQLAHRITYYKEMISCVIRTMQIDLSQLEFIIGSSFQKSPEYIMDIYRLSAIETLHDAKKAGSEVVKQSDDPKMSSLIYPGMQALDEEHLHVDAQTSGVDQRKILVLSDKFLPKLGYKKRIHLMTPMLSAINSMPLIKSTSVTSVTIESENTKEENISEKKMSSSNLDSKIDFLDDKKSVEKKIKSAYCLEGDMTHNPLMEMTKLVIFPLMSHLKQNQFVIPRPDKYGGTITYDSYEELEKEFINKILHPADLKLGLHTFLNNFFEPIRQYFSSNEMKDLVKKAYP